MAAAVRLIRLSSMATNQEKQINREMQIFVREVMPTQEDGRRRSRIILAKFVTECSRMKRCPRRAASNNFVARAETAQRRLFASKVRILGGSTFYTI